MMHLAEPELTIILTGFGPFQSYDSNPSEEVVERIAKEGVEDIHPNARIIVKVMPVVYDDVQCTVSEIWEKYHPDLVVHLGVHSINNAIKIETRSCGIGYYQRDIESKTPEDYRCPLADYSFDEEKSIICTGLDCEGLLEALRTKFSGESVQFELSDNPGKYLCAYSYYISLRHNRNCSLFVHIPRFDKNCTLELITKIVKEIIRISILQILKTRKNVKASMRTDNNSCVTHSW